MRFDFSGFDKLRRQLNKLAEATEAMEGQHEVTMDDLFIPLFMLENTNYGSITEFFEASPFIIKTQKDLDEINPDQLDSFVREKTRFQSWEEMKGAAGQEWIKARFDEKTR